MNIFAIAAIIYVFYLNSYPMDYVNGKLLVNPQHALRTSITFDFYALGLVNGCFICRRFFPFELNGISIKRRIIRGIIGGILLLIILNYPVQWVFDEMFQFKIGLIIQFFAGFFITAIYPALFKFAERLYK